MDVRCEGGPLDGSFHELTGTLRYYPDDREEVGLYALRGSVLVWQGWKPSPG